MYYKIKTDDPKKLERLLFLSGIEDYEVTGGRSKEDIIKSRLENRKKLKKITKYVFGDKHIHLVIEGSSLIIQSKIKIRDTLNIVGWDVVEISNFILIYTNGKPNIIKNRFF